MSFLVSFCNLSSKSYFYLSNSYEFYFAANSTCYLFNCFSFSFIAINLYWKSCSNILSFFSLSSISCSLFLIWLRYSLYIFWFKLNYPSNYLSYSCFCLWLSLYFLCYYMTFSSYSFRDASFSLTFCNYSSRLALILLFSFSNSEIYLSFSFSSIDSIDDRYFSALSSMKSS